MKYTTSNIIKFIIPSLLGIIFFIIPLPYGKIIPLEGMAEVNIGVGALSDMLKILLSDYLLEISLAVISTSAILSIIAKFIKFKNEFFNTLFNVTPFWFICRVLGAIFTAMVVIGFGPKIITSLDNGGSMIQLIPSLIGVFFFTGYLLPLIVDFGFMDFVGTLISKYMQKLFKVPGRAAIDAISSWLGDGTLGVMITETQYKKGYYTAKESVIIAVCFSLVSLPFSTVIADSLDLMPQFVSFYGTVCIASLACALILPRIYPISKFKNETYKGVEHKKEVLDFNGSIFKCAINRALLRAKNAPGFKAIMIEGAKFTLDLYLGLLPLCMAWGTITLIISNETPLFEYISLPFEYLFNLINLPNASEAASAVLIGFADMFIPSIMVSGADIAPITKFVIGTLSVSQLIYLTETGAVILKSCIPLNIKDLFIIYLIRTFISLPIILIIANILY